MNRTTFDPYATLGVPRSATQHQVQQAYRRLAKRYHPDLNPDARASVNMQRVNQAWEILSSRTRRARYDAESAARPSAGPGHWSAQRRTGPASSASTTWNGPWASPPPAARTYASAPDQEGDGPGWSSVVLMIAIGLVALVALFAGLLPFPLVGIAVLVLVRGAVGRFDEAGR